MYYDCANMYIRFIPTSLQVSFKSYRFMLKSYRWVGVVPMILVSATVPLKLIWVLNWVALSWGWA